MRYFDDVDLTVLAEIYAAVAVLLGCLLRGLRRSRPRGLARQDSLETSRRRVYRRPAFRAEDVPAGDGSVSADTQFLFDVVARRTESAVQNIDALDNGIVAIIVGIIAVALVVTTLFPQFK